MASEISLGLGEYITLYVLAAVVIIGILGFLFGTGAGGAIVFIIGAGIVVLLTYAILARVWRLLLHGSLSAGGGSR